MARSRSIRIRAIGLGIAAIAAALTALRPKKPELPTVIHLGPIITKPKVMFAENCSQGLFLAPDGSLWHWGRRSMAWPDARPEPKRVGRTNLWADAATTTGMTAGIRPDGTLWGWGWRRPGFFPMAGPIDWNKLDGDNPIQIAPGNDWRIVIGGQNNYFLAFKSDHTLWAWGINTSGQLGDGSNIDRYKPAQIGSAANWIAAWDSGAGGAGLQADGTLWEWGRDANGPHGEQAYRPPVRWGRDSDWADFLPGFGCWFALKRDGSLWGTGSDVSHSFHLDISSRTNWVRCGEGGRPGDYVLDDNHLFHRRADGTVWASGENGLGSFGDGQTNRWCNWVAPKDSAQVRAITGCRALWSGGDANAALTTNGVVWLWGRHYGTAPLSSSTVWNLRCDEFLAKYGIRALFGQDHYFVDPTIYREVLTHPIPLIQLEYD